MRQKGDSVFLLTLIDLLVQLIFLALFLVAIFFALQKQEDSKINDPPVPIPGIIKKIGIIKVAELVDAMVKLVPIERIMELVVILPEFQTIEALKSALSLAKAAKFDPAILEAQVKELIKKTGSGPPVCEIGGDKKNNLMTIEGYSDHYVLSTLSLKAIKIFSDGQLSYKPGDMLTFEQFDRLAKKVSESDKECKFRISYDPMVDSLRSYRGVTKYFYSSFVQ